MIPEEAATSNSLETNLDPKVKEALNQMAAKVRQRARNRAAALQKDISMLIGDFLRDYARPYDVKGQSPSVLITEGVPDNRQWEQHVGVLCKALGNHVAEIDVERCVQNLSAKILEIDEANK